MIFLEPFTKILCKNRLSISVYQQVFLDLLNIERPIKIGEALLVITRLYNSLCFHLIGFY
jgi:hypothetical protein